VLLLRLELPSPAVLVLVALSDTQASSGLVKAHGPHSSALGLDIIASPTLGAQAQGTVLAALCTPSDMQATVSRVLDAARVHLIQAEQLAYSLRPRLSAPVSPDRLSDSGVFCDESKDSASGSTAEPSEAGDEPLATGARSPADELPSPTLTGPGPLDASRGLALCTWEALSHQRPYLSMVLDALAALEERAPGATTALLLDDGWACTSSSGFGRGRLDAACLDPALLDAPAPEDPDALASYISAVHERFPAVRDFGVWLTLIGYWDGVSAEEYGPLQRATLQGPDGPCEALLPAIESLDAFWDKTLGGLAEAGVTFVKLDAQGELASMRLEGSSSFGSEEALYVRAAQRAFDTAASRHLGPNAVIHCMAMGKGQPASLRALAPASTGQWRSTDDIVPGHTDAARWLLVHAARIVMLFDGSHQPDADMLCTSNVGALEAQAQARFRAVYSGARIFTSDRASAEREAADALQSLLAPTRSKSGIIAATRPLQAQDAARLLPGSMWEDVTSNADGAALVVAQPRQLAEQVAVSSIAAFNVRAGDASTVGTLRTCDIADALAGSSAHDVAVCDASCEDFAVVTQAELAAQSDRLGCAPVLPIRLAVGESRSWSVAPLLALGDDVQAACLGLKDKYLPLAALRSLRTSSVQAKPQTLSLVHSAPTFQGLSPSAILLAVMLILTNTLHAISSHFMLLAPLRRILLLVQTQLARRASVVPAQLRDSHVVVDRQERSLALRSAPPTQSAKRQELVALVDRAGTLVFFLSRAATPRITIDDVPVSLSHITTRAVAAGLVVELDMLAACAAPEVASQSRADCCWEVRLSLE
jgi:hypothetical protein